jgi:hypothetical protein
MNYRYALLTYSTDNLGDEIQSIAARRFLPRIDALCNRDYLSNFNPKPSLKYKLILNGWYMNRPEHWPPSNAIVPLMVSIHLSQEVFKENIARLPALQTLLGGANLDYFRAHAPIGARDTWTCEHLRKHGIESYFSACLSLVLDQPDNVVRSDYICVNDAGSEVEAYIQRRSRSPVVLTHHIDQTIRDPLLRMQQAEKLIRTYAGARCVITTRLHCAMPCLALNTPVLFLPTQPDAYRFSGLIDLLHSSSPERLINDRSDFDIDEPPPNPARYLSYRNSLISRCQGFVAA